MALDEIGIRIFAGSASARFAEIRPMGVSGPASGLAAGGHLPPLISPQYARAYSSTGS